MEYTLVVIISIPILSTLLSSMTIEVLIPLQNETVILGREGHFFCQLRGTAEQLRFNGLIYGRHYMPDDISVNTTYHIKGKMDELNVFNITITIMASKERNNTIVECYDLTKRNGSKAHLIVQGIHAIILPCHLLQRCM